MANLPRAYRVLISAVICFVLFGAVGWQAFQWTFCYWYVDEGYSLQLTYKGPPLPIPGLTLPASADTELAQVDDKGRPKQIGVLAEMVGPGRHFYNPFFWECKKVPDVVVEAKQVAVVTSRIGKETAAKQNLVDGELGQTEYQGNLRKLLGPGRYRINPRRYEVTVIKGEEIARTADGQETRSGWVAIMPGYVGVVTNLTGNPITQAKDGLQTNVLPPGIYPINKWEQQINVVNIGFREKSIETSLAMLPDGHPQVDPSGEPVVADDESGISFTSDDGFPIRLDFTAIWGIMPDQAVDVIDNFGNEAAVEDKVVLTQMRNLCRTYGAKLKAAELLDGETRQRYQEEVSRAFHAVLEGKGLSVQQGLVRNSYIPQEVRLPIQLGYISDELKLTREQEQLTAMTEGDLKEAEEKVKLQTEQIKVETEKMVAVKLAEGQKTAAETKGKTVKLVAAIARETAEIDKQSTITLGTATSTAKKGIEEAKADKFKLAVEAFGSGQSYNQWVFAQGLPEDIELNLLYAGEGTFWTDLKGFGEAFLGKQLKQQTTQSPSQKTTK